MKFAGTWSCSCGITLRTRGCGGSSKRNLQEPRGVARSLRVTTLGSRGLCGGYELVLQLLGLALETLIHNSSPEQDYSSTDSAETANSHTGNHTVQRDADSECHHVVASEAADDTVTVGSAADTSEKHQCRHCGEEFKAVSQRMNGSPPRRRLRSHVLWILDTNVTPSTRQHMASTSVSRSNSKPLTAMALMRAVRQLKAMAAVSRTALGPSLRVNLSPRLHELDAGTDLQQHLQPDITDSAVSSHHRNVSAADMVLHQDMRTMRQETITQGSPDFIEREMQLGVATAGQRR